MKEPEANFRFVTKKNDVYTWNRNKKIWYRNRDQYEVSERELEDILKYFYVDKNEIPYEQARTTSAYELEERRSNKIGRKKRTYTLMYREVIDETYDEETGEWRKIENPKDKRTELRATTEDGFSSIEALEKLCEEKRNNVYMIKEWRDPPFTTDNNVEWGIMAQI